MSDQYTYPGDELSLFQHATNWKKYFFSRLMPYVKGDVLEAGAGLGANTKWLYNNKITHLVLLEPDTEMSLLLKEKVESDKTKKNITVINGTLNEVTDQRFDAILYIDVLEHIEKDREEMMKAVSLLKPNGHLVVLSPAFQSLYSPFDKEIGHYRRYTKKQLRKITPRLLRLVKLQYLDSIGFFASAANRMMLKQSSPSIKQVHLWDKWMIPVSKFTDKLFFHSFGKSILGIWQKT
ncbi:MAG: class I SAM-dependent methyltransferase [Chitinophagaceae bacterium]